MRSVYRSSHLRQHSVDVNQLKVTYAYARANASIDTSLVVSGARLDAPPVTLRATENGLCIPYVERDHGDVVVEVRALAPG